MSRIGNRKLNIPENVTVSVENRIVTVKGPKGELTLTLTDGINVSVEENVVTVTRDNEQKKIKSMHGTTNSLISNMIKGVSEGYAKNLEINGVGYNLNVKGNKLAIKAGFSHPVEVEIPNGITVEQVSNTEISIKGINKELVGEFAANIREYRKPEPYKGKGIRYKDEYIRRKEGKKASK